MGKYITSIPLVQCCHMATYLFYRRGTAHSINHTVGLQPYSHTPVFQAVEPSVIPSLK